MIKLIKRVSSDINRPIGIWYMDSETLMYRTGDLLRESYSDSRDSGLEISKVNTNGDGEIIFYY